MIYKTHQRDCIIALLKNSDRPITAEEVSYTLKAGGTPVGLTTVYRTLAALVKSGDVRKFEAENGSTYQYVGDHSDCHSHLHFKCAECGRLFHVDCELLDSITEHIKSDHNFVLDSDKTVFYGHCAECVGKDEK